MLSKDMLSNEMLSKKTLSNDMLIKDMLSNEMLSNEMLSKAMLSKDNGRPVYYVSGGDGRYEHCRHPQNNVAAAQEVTSNFLQRPARAIKWPYSRSSGSTPLRCIAA